MFKGIIFILLCVLEPRTIQQTKAGASVCGPGRRARIALSLIKYIEHRMHCYTLALSGMLWKPA